MAAFSTKVENYVGEIVLNRPDKLNVLSLAWSKELASIVKRMEESDDVRVILIWAEGRMFTAGLDLTELNGTYLKIRSHCEQRLRLQPKGLGQKLSII